MRVVRSARLAWLLAPGALTVVLSFNAGGFFPEAVGLAAVALAVALVLRVTLADDPFGGLSRPLAVAAGGLALLAAWQLLSSLWSGAAGRALIEFDRTLLYLLALLLFGLPARRSGQMRVMLWGVAAAAVGVSACALATRLLPGVWPTAQATVDDRLSYPLTYWNALGLLAAIGLVLCAHLASSLREPRVARVLGAAALPVLATTLLLTFSRGAIVVAAIGLVAYALLALPRGLPSALVAGAVPTALAVRAGYGAELLATEDATTPAALAQGRELALVVAGAALAAALVRAALLPLDTRLDRIQLRRPRMALGAAAVAVVAAAVAAGLALDVPERARASYDRFVAGNQVATGGDVRGRLSELGNNGRIAHWKVALEALADEPLTGLGAGTYEVVWAERRPMTFTVTEAHSLYLEIGAELGSVGLALLAAALAPILLAFVRRPRGPERGVYAALAAAAVIWLIHAGIDWDWEMPAVTLWLFCLGGAALAAQKRDGSRAGLPPAGRTARVLVSLGLLVLALTPGLVARSQLWLDDSRDAFRAGRCPEAIDAALGSLEAIGARAEPYEVLGYCNYRLGHPQLAVEALQKAVERDPRNWEYHYALALVQAAARADPRAEARLALELNPRSTLAQKAVRHFRTDDPGTWERRALTARLP